MIAAYPLLAASKEKEATGVYKFRKHPKHLYRGARHYYIYGYLPVILLEAIISEQINGHVHSPLLAAMLSGLLVGALFAPGETAALNRRLVNIEQKNKVGIKGFLACSVNVVSTLKNTRGLVLTAIREGLFSAIVIGDLKQKSLALLVGIQKKIFLRTYAHITVLTYLLASLINFIALYTTQIPAAIASYQQGVAAKRMSIWQAMAQIKAEGKEKGKNTLQSFCRGGGLRIAAIAVTSFIFPLTKQIFEQL